VLSYVIDLNNVNNNMQIYKAHEV